MKLFGRSSGYYLFWTGFVYFWVGMYLALTHTALTEYASLGFVLVLSVPLWCPPVARYFNMEPMMFDWFRNFRDNRYADGGLVSDMGKIGEDMSKVVKFPELKAVPTPEPEPEKPAKVFYRLGLSDNNRVSLSMYYGEILMNRAGVQSLIDQLEFYRDRIEEDDEE